MSSPDAQRLFNMTENDSDGNAGKERKIQCDLSLSHDNSASFFENKSGHGDGGSTDQLVQNALLGKTVNKAIFGNDSVKFKHETRTVRSRMLSKEEIDFHLLTALAFHNLPRKKSNQLSSILGVVMKRCMYPTFHDKFQVKKMYTASHDIRTKYISKVDSIMNTLSMPKVISYNQFACIEFNEAITICWVMVLNCNTCTLILQ